MIDLGVFKTFSSVLENYTFTKIFSFGHVSFGIDNDKIFGWGDNHEVLYKRFKMY